MDQEIITLLLDCLHQDQDRLDISKLTALSIQDWENLIALAASLRVRPLLYQSLKRRGLEETIPEKSIQALKDFYTWNSLRNLCYFAELKRIAAALTKESIPLIALKGIYLSNIVYESIGLREMVDLDLLAPKERMSQAVRILESQGYEPLIPSSVEVDEGHHQLTPFIKSGMVGSVELHWTLTVPDQHYSIDVRGLWERAIPAGIDGVEVRGLSPEDLLLHLCLHTSYQHLFAFGLGPSCDIAQVTSHYGKSLDWEQVVERAKQWNRERGVYLALRVAKELIGARIPDDELNKLKPADLDETPLQTAISLIFTDRKFVTPLAAPLTLIMEEAGWQAKLRGFLSGLFISKRSLARTYSLSPASPKIYWFYLVRLKYLLQKYGGVAWRRQHKDPQLTRWARRTLTLRNWLKGERRIEKHKTPSIFAISPCP